ncbi:hypothetical protein RY27_23115, partial [Litorilinea aerophila]
MWQFYLLGGFQFVVDREPADQFEADSARALCAYLVLHQGETLRREPLAALFWPDQPQSDALRNLRTALSRTRRGLGPLSDALQADRQTVTFLPTDQVWVDALEVTALAAHVETHAHRHLVGCPFCLEKWQRIVQLYQGEFLAGFTQESDLFQEWASVQRERYHRMVVQALDALTAYHLRRNEWAEAQHQARRALQLEPWREESHRHLIFALAQQGQRSAALQQFHTCREILQRELAAPPQAETMELYETLLHHPERLSPDHAPRSPLQLCPTGAHWLHAPPPVGRQPQLATLLG